MAVAHCRTAGFAKSSWQRFAVIQGFPPYGRLSRKILTAVNEVNEGGGANAHRHADKLRTLLTDEVRAVNPKYGREHEEFMEFVRTHDRRIEEIESRKGILERWFGISTQVP